MWKPVVEFPEHYAVSSDGQVRRIATRYTRRSGKPLSTFAQTSGHLVVNLSVDGVRHRRYVHRLVAEAFLPKSDDVVRHLDGQPSNNSVENLAWGTAYDNHLDTVRHGRFKAPSYPVRPYCKNGHEFTPENTIIRKDSGRACRICSRARSRAWYARKHGIRTDAPKDVLEQ